jgi:outer membrane protein assembly factor BamD
MFALSSRIAAALALLFAAACRPDFQLRRFTTNEALYEAAQRELQARRWGNAVAALEKLVSDLSPRDTLLPRVHWHLGKAHQGREEWLLAAQSFTRLADAFPEDSLADDAMLEAARSYRRLWRRPALDPQYGEMAMATYRQFLGLFPNSPLAEQANAGIRELEEWFARKSYDNGRFYVKRKAPDSAILYFRYVRETYPNAGIARDAGLRLVEVYRSINYRDDAAEVCAELRQKHANDRDVQALCPEAPNPPPQAQPVAPPQSTVAPSP